MSYDNTICPCGGKKPLETMLCDECNAAFKDHPSMKAFMDDQASLPYRRQAAIVLVSLARKRKRCDAVA